MEHLNDPNFDLSHPPSFTSSIKEEPTKRYGRDGHEGFDFDELELFYPPISFYRSNNIP